MIKITIFEETDQTHERMLAVREMLEAEGERVQLEYNDARPAKFPLLMIMFGAGFFFGAAVLYAILLF